MCALAVSVADGQSYSIWRCVGYAWLRISYLIDDIFFMHKSGFCRA